MMRNTGSFSAVFALLVVTILVTMSHSGTNCGAEARYLPTRSDPLAAPAGPPRGEDPRFDHLYDILKEVVIALLLSQCKTSLMCTPIGTVKGFKLK